MDFIEVRNLEGSKEFEKKVKNVLNTERSTLFTLGKGLVKEPIEVFLVSEIKPFVEKEFIDIEKLRILARYLILEELPVIHAITILDKIIISDGNNVLGSLVHAYLHALMYLKIDPYHYVDNYMELRFHREELVSYLVHNLRREIIGEGLKLVEKTYLYLLSSLKHYVIYKYAISKGVREAVSRDVDLVEEWINQVIKERGFYVEERIKINTYMAVIEKLGLEIELPKKVRDEYIIEETKRILSKPVKLRNYREPNEVLKKAVEIALIELKREKL